MGWYVTCLYCKSVEKYRHPNCDCREKNQKKILDKLIGATVVDCFIKNVDGVPQLYTQYTLRKSTEMKTQSPYCTSIVLENCDGEQTIHETMIEISLDVFEAIKDGKYDVSTPPTVSPSTSPLKTIAPS